MKLFAINDGFELNNIYDSLNKYIHEMNNETEQFYYDNNKNNKTKMKKSKKKF